MAAFTIEIVGPAQPSDWDYCEGSIEPGCSRVIIRGPGDMEGVHTVDNGPASTRQPFPITISSLSSGAHTIKLEAFGENEVSPGVTLTAPIRLPEPNRTRLDNVKTVVLILAIATIIALAIYVYRYVEFERFKDRLRSLSPKRVFASAKTVSA